MPLFHAHVENIECGSMPMDGSTTSIASEEDLPPMFHKIKPIGELAKSTFFRVAIIHGIRFIKIAFVFSMPVQKKQRAMKGMCTLHFEQ